MTKYVIFDLGGVVVELGKHPIPPQWLDAEKSFSFKDWFQSDIALSFERGLTSPDAFASALKATLGLNVDNSDVLAQFTQWPVGLFPSMPSLLTSLKQDYTLVAFTNTNSLHYPRLIDEFKLETYFDHIFASHLMHLAKPDLAAFEHVLQALGTTADQVIFIDDNIANIQTARNMGIHALHASGEAAVTLALKQAGVF
ncbi:HAD family hydrolase [Thaumasiovibrio subtropicus]|uniref:HAD family hydrolase n=1 Tax=Thaumasiovibrio subtropicus TaxID=1891207 RepID=UPI000B35A71D|nr:HAD family phosphatase [Thaumasiovibrio subtropicus]